MSHNVKVDLRSWLRGLSTLGALGSHEISDMYVYKQIRIKEETSNLERVFPSHLLSFRPSATTRTSWKKLTTKMMKMQSLI